MSTEHPPTSEPRIAIVVTCFNDGATLGETIASIMRVPDDLELVVVDDGSTDSATIAVLAALEREGIAVIRQSNQGPSAAAMSGFRATSALLFMRFDSDDLLEPGAVAVLADRLDAAPATVAAAWGDVQTFGITTFRIPTAPALDPWLVTYVNCVPGAGCLYRREALEACGGWQLREGHEDWDVWMSLAELGYSGAYVPVVAFHYRRDDGGRLKGSLARTTEHYDALRRRHQALFARRRENRERSGAPTSLKLAVTAVETMPWVPRQAKIQLCELFTHLLWNGGLGSTATMARQAAALRLRRRGGRRD